MKLSFEYIEKILKLMNELQIYEVKIRFKKPLANVYLLIKKPFFSFEENCFKLEIYDERPCYNDQKPDVILRYEIEDIEKFKSDENVWKYLKEFEIADKDVDF